MKKHKENQAGYNALQEKLKKLESDYSTTKEKLKMCGYKDSSENGDWIALNEKLTICQSQIDSLKNKIAEMSRENDKIITYLLLATGEKRTVRLTSGETDPDQGKISRNSPVGMALSDKRVGEITEVKTSQGEYQAQILNIEEE